MSWQLGVDLGTTFTAAATYQNNKASIFSLGNKAAPVPSVVYASESGELLTGDAAVRRASAEPERIARVFKRRLGDETPTFLAGSPYHAETFMAEMLKDVVAQTESQLGSAPTKIALTHPANWGGFKKDLLRQTVSLAGLDPNNVLFLTEPEAAAISYACNEKLAIGDKLAVYDLGGGTFDTTVVERVGDGFRVIGKPEGIENIGGVDFDAAVYTHITKSIAESIQALDYDDPVAIAAVARLKRDCVEAKEALSSDSDTNIPVMLPNLQTSVRITRKEFEDLSRPAISATIEATQRAISSAEIAAEDITKILLVGGSSRIPLVSQMVQSELGRPLAIDSHPKHAVALGAAFKAGGAQLLTPNPAPHTAPAASPVVAAPAAIEFDQSRGDQTVEPAPTSAFASANVPEDPNLDQKAGPVSSSMTALPPTLRNQTGSNVNQPRDVDQPTIATTFAAPSTSPTPSKPTSPSWAETGPNRTDRMPTQTTQDGQLFHASSYPPPERPRAGGSGILMIAALGLLAIILLAGGAYAVTQLGSTPADEELEDDTTTTLEDDEEQESTTTAANEDTVEEENNQVVNEVDDQTTTTEQETTTTAPTTTVEDPTTTEPEAATTVVDPEVTFDTVSE